MTTAVRRASGGVLARGGRRAHLLQRAVRPQLLVVAALLPHGEVVDRLEVLLVLGADRRDVRLAHADVLRLEHRIQLLALAVVLGVPLRLHLAQQEGLALARLLAEACAGLVRDALLLRTHFAQTRYPPPLRLGLRRVEWHLVAALAHVGFVGSGWCSREGRPER